MKKKTRKRIGKLSKSIEICLANKKEIVSNVNLIKKQYTNNQLTKAEYEHLYRKYLKGKTKSDWVKYYDDKIYNYKKEINEIRKQNPINAFDYGLLGIIILLATIFANMIAVNNLIGLAVYDAQNQTATLIVNEFIPQTSLIEVDVNGQKNFNFIEILLSEEELVNSTFGNETVLGYNVGTLDIDLTQFSLTTGQYNISTRITHNDEEIYSSEDTLNIGSEDISFDIIIPDTSHNTGEEITFEILPSNAESSLVIAAPSGEIVLLDGHSYTPLIPGEYEVNALLYYLEANDRIIKTFNVTGEALYAEENESETSTETNISLFEEAASVANVSTPTNASDATVTNATSAEVNTSNVTEAAFFDFYIEKNIYSISENVFMHIYPENVNTSIVVLHNGAYELVDNKSYTPIEVGDYTINALLYTEGQSKRFTVNFNVINNKSFITLVVPQEPKINETTVVFTEFDNKETTNFSKMTEKQLEAVDDVVIAEPEAGVIEFKEDNLNLTGTNLDEAIEIKYNFIEVDVEEVPELNVSATLTIYNVPYSNPIVYMDGSPCPADVCTNIIFDTENITFDVPHFTNFTTGHPGVDNTSLVIFDQADAEGGGKQANITQTIIFYANYTNISVGANGNPINDTTDAGECNISFAAEPIGPFNMSFNESNKFYEYNRTFSAPYTNMPWNVTCLSLEGARLSVTDNITIINNAVCGASLTTNMTLTENLTFNNTCFTVSANNVTIDCNGFTVNGNGSGNGIFMSSYENNTLIKNCVVSNFSTAVFGIHTTNTTIINNTFINSTTAVRFQSFSRSINITNNTFFNSTAAVFCTSCRGEININRNFFYGSNDEAVQLEDATANIVDNVFVRNKGEIYIQLDSGPDINYTNITNNNFTNSTGSYAIRLQMETPGSMNFLNISNNTFTAVGLSHAILGDQAAAASHFRFVTITNNTIVDATRAILLHNLSNSTISDNLISITGAAIEIDLESSNNVIKRNVLNSITNGILIAFGGSGNGNVTNYIIDNNTISNVSTTGPFNGYCIAIGADATYSVSHSNITVSNNTIVNCSNVGIEIRATVDNNNITKNIIISSAFGIRLSGPVGGFISSNNISNMQGIGIAIINSTIGTPPEQIIVINNYIYNISTGLNLSNGRGITLSNNTILNFSTKGMFITNTTLNITNTTIRLGRDGIVADPSNITIRDTTIQDNSGTGINITNSSIAHIINNTIRNNTGYGIVVELSSVANITNNTIVNNTLGGINLLNVTNNSITFNNIINHTSSFGISLTGTNNSTLHNNTFLSNNLSINLLGSSANLFFFNNISNSLALQAFADIAGNIFNITSGGKAAGNYWSDILSNNLGIFDSEADTFGDIGLDYPYNNTNGGNVSTFIEDFGPIVFNATPLCLLTLTSNFTMFQNLTSNGTCFTISANDVTLDCAGFSIRGNTSGYAVNITNYINNTNIINCIISNFSVGVRGNKSINITIENNSFIRDQNPSVAAATILFATSSDSSNINITNNTFMTNNRSVIIHNVSQLSLLRNIFKDSMYVQVELTDTRANIIGNLFSNLTNDTIVEEVNGLELHHSTTVNYHHYANISNNNFTGIDRNGIATFGSTSFTNISNNTFTNIRIQGMVISGSIKGTSDSVVITSNRITDTGSIGFHAIRTTNITNTTIANNNLTRVGRGIGIDGGNTSNVTVSGNRIISVLNFGGIMVVPFIEFGNTSKIVINNNIIANVGNSCIRLGTGNPAVGIGANITIINNNLSNCTKSGIQAMDGYEDINISNNTITHVVSGIELIKATDVFISSNNITNANQSGIIIRNTTSEVDIVNNYIYNSTVYGINSTNTRQLEIRNNTILNSSGKAVFAVNTTLNITNNTIRNGVDGIVVDPSNITITDTVIEDNLGTGINITNNSIATIINSTIRNNTGYGIVIELNSTANITLNTISNNTLSGIFISQSINNTITLNTIQTSSAAGIRFASGANNTTVYNNTFLNNNISIDIIGSTANVFFFNNISNSLALQAASDTAGNEFNTTIAASGNAGGNYWSDIIANGLDITDSDADTFGDIGTDYPYNNTNGGNVTTLIIDNGPIVFVATPPLQPLGGASGRRVPPAPTPQPTPTPEPEPVPKELLVDYNFTFRITRNGDLIFDKEQLMDVIVKEGEATLNIEITNIGRNVLNNITLEFALPEGVEITRIIPGQLPFIRTNESGKFTIMIKSTLGKAFDFDLVGVAKEVTKRQPLKATIPPEEEKPEFDITQLGNWFLPSVGFLLLLFLLGLSVYSYWDIIWDNFLQDIMSAISVMIFYRPKVSDEGTVNKMIKFKKIGKYRKLRVTEKTFNKYGTKFKNLRPIKLSFKQKAQLKGFTDKYKVDMEMAQLLIYARSKINVRVITTKPKPVKLAFDKKLKKLKFINPFEHK